MNFDMFPQPSTLLVSKGILAPFSPLCTHQHIDDSWILLLAWPVMAGCCAMRDACPPPPAWVPPRNTECDMYFSVTGIHPQ